MKIFYSYCHEDEKYRERLEKFLTSLRDSKKITEWHDRKITAGDEWQNDIRKSLEDSDIVLLLISQDFLVSKACKEEMEFALNPENNKTAIPIILKPCAWLQTDLKNIQAVPKDGKPIIQWDNEDSAWLDVVNKITATIDTLSTKPKKDFLEKINKTEFRSSGKDCILLSDIFVAPEFEFSTIDGKSDKKFFEFSEFVSEKNRFCFICGESLSGKTSFLYKIFNDSINKDFYPLLIDGDTVKKTRNFDECIQKALVEQYRGLDFKAFNKKSEKILLIDNYSHSISDNFIFWAKENFEYIYIAIDVNEKLLFFKDSKIFIDFNIAALRNLGRASRYALIKNWKSLERNNFTTDEQFQNEIDVLEQNVNSIILDKSILPNTPFYILTIIQSFETFMPQDFQITSYGHCYYAIIYAKLNSIGLSQSDIDDSLNYLTHLAKAIFDNCVNNQWVLSINDYQNFKNNYKNEYLIGDGLLARIEDETCSILKISNEKISFSYPFIFYYFIGKHLAISAETKIIEGLCSKIYNKDYANILIFTIHHAINTELLDEIELYCLVSLDKFKVAQLTTDETSFMDDLISAFSKEIEHSKNTKSTEEKRMIARREQDKIEEETKELDDISVDENSDSEIIEIERSMKIIEVIGQIIKNRSGSFKKIEIKELILEVEKLGLRILTYFLDTLKNPDFKEWIFERISLLEKQRNSQFDKKRVEKIVEQNIEMMGFIFIIGMLQKTYLSLTTKKIISLQEEISDNENTVAFDFFLIFFKLNYEGINFNVIENYYNKFYKTDNSWAIGVLKLLVKSYLDTHNVDFRKRQKLANLLHFQYEPNKPKLN